MTHRSRGAALNLSQEEFARLVGMSRQTLNGHLRSVGAEGLLDVTFPRVCVPDIPRLRARSVVDVGE